MFPNQQLTQNIINLDYITVKEIADINLKKTQIHIEVKLFHNDKQEKVQERQWGGGSRHKQCCFLGTLHK